MTERDVAIGDSPRIDYVVVAFRSERHIVACLDAIDADRPGGSRVIVIDNDSPDASASVARAHACRPLVIVSPRNLGFGGACNLAMDVSTAEIMFFVNPDARLQQGATAALKSVFAAYPAVVAVGPKVQDPAESLRAASAGFEPSLRSTLGHFLLMARLPLVARWFAPLQLPFGSPAQEVDWVGGAALMVRSEAFRRIGGFDASMFMYMEDVDLCRRLRAHGVVRYEPAAMVEHDVGGSQGPEQAERWLAAFHRYVIRHHGHLYARATSAIAAVGLGMRAVVLTVARPAHSRRLFRAARAAVRLAALTNPPDHSIVEA